MRRAAGLFGLVFFFAALVVVACARKEPPACAPATLAAIEAAYVAEALDVCRGQSFDSCTGLSALEAKYRTQREAWITCR